MFSANYYHYTWQSTNNLLKMHNGLHQKMKKRPVYRFDKTIQGVTTLFGLPADNGRGFT